jgi:AcrR family transcriptional regulator
VRRVAPKSERAAWGTLNRARVLDAALRLADAEGFQPLTMRRLAQELGVAPMAIYNHYKNKDELLVALLDHVVGLLEVPTEGGWEATLRGFALAARETLLTHPGVVPLFVTVPALLTNSLRLGEKLYKVLRDEGFDDEAVVRAFYAVLSYTLGYVALEVPRRPPPSEADGPRLAEMFFASLPGDELPLTVELAPYVATFASAEQFVYGLDLLLAGIAATAAPSPATTGEGK